VKWRRTRDGLKGTELGNHSLRHGMENLLRAGGCPGDVRDRITGHKPPGMGARYGEGYPLPMLAAWLMRATGAFGTEAIEKRDARQVVYRNISGAA
jgi:integrase